MKQFNTYIFEKLKIKANDNDNNFLLNVFNSKSPKEFEHNQDILLNYLNDHCSNVKLLKRSYNEYILDPSIKNNDDIYIYVGKDTITFGTYNATYILYYSTYFDSTKVTYAEDGFASFVTTAKKLITSIGVFIVTNEYSLVEQIEQLKAKSED